MHELLDAIAAGDLERVRAILDRDPSAASARGQDGVSAVLQARYRDREDMVAVLLAVGPELDVFDAAALGNTDRVAELLDERPDRANAWSADGFTPLHLAVFFGHPHAARVLLGRGAKVGAVSRNRMEVMPLHSASAGRHRDAVEVLLDAGSEVDARSHGGFTALHDAAANGDREIVELLLARGADPGLTEDRGKTPRELALEKGHQDVADLLEDRG